MLPPAARFLSPDENASALVSICPARYEPREVLMDTSNSTALELAARRRSFTLATRVAASVFPVWFGVLLFPGIDLVARSLLVGLIPLLSGMVWFYARLLDP